MRKVLEIISLELKTLVRSKTLALLLVASVGWVLAFPQVMQGDGTPEGARELCLHYSLGGVFFLLVAALLASATGSIARERTAKRLQLTLVRPVRYFSVALGKILAHVAVGAFVLAVACLTLALGTDLSKPCSHVLSPILPSPREAAKVMYEKFLQDPNTPDELKRTKKSIMLRIMENRAIDQYQTIPTNTTAYWRFERARIPAEARDLAVRLRFTNQYAMRQDAFGLFTFGTHSGLVSNVTQSVLTVPLRPTDLASADADKLLFANRGKTPLMLCPRKDLNLLVPADAFWRNLLRAYVELVSILALIVSFGIFLSAGLGRPVALFVAFVTLAVSEMSPSVAQQYPDELETDLIDHVGLCITRFSATVTRPVSTLAPLEALAKDECVEPSETLRFALADLVAVPLAFALLTALVLPRKQDEN